MINWKELSFDDKQHKACWNFVYDELGFKPKFKTLRADIFKKQDADCIIDFKVRLIGYKDGVYNYNLYNQWNSAIKKALQEVSISNNVYALDWQHVSFIFNPNKPFEQKDYGELWPVPAYPDGDHIFFLTPDYKSIYFGHAFEEYAMLFGKDLVESVLKHIELLGLSDNVKITMKGND